MSRWLSRAAAILPVGLLLAARPADAQPAPGSRPHPGRPTIGVALEGGGAHGLAHIGVLEWLEANHIPIDSIAGTSMGGLVGALYATGKSPADMRALIAGVDWDLVLSGSIAYRNLTFRRREDLRAYPNALLIGLQHGVRLPPGLNAGQQVTLLVDRETLAYSEVGTFDELPIPFRCVATDLVTGKPRVFADGPLAEALRATMSLPGLFNPVRSSAHVYADGGMVDNLPTDVVRQMGADVVIGVHLREKEVEAGDIQSMFDVLGRSMDLMVAANEARGLAGADVVVSVGVEDVGAAEYRKGSALIERGAAAAAAAAPALQRYALDEVDWAAHLRDRVSRRREIVPVPQFVRVEGTDARACRHLEDFLAPFVGKAIDGKRLDRDLTRLSGIGKFSRVGYRIVREDGREGLLVTVEENGYAPPMMQLGFELDGTDAGNVGFTLGARLTVMDLGGYRSEWRTDVLFGSTYGVRGEYYRPWTASSKWFLAPELGASRSSFVIDDKEGPLAEYRIDRWGAAVDVGHGFSRFVQARVGYEAGHLEARRRIGTPELGEVRGGVGGGRFRLVYDQTDDPVIPRRGAAVEAAAHWYDRSPGARGSFPSATMRATRYQPISRKGSVFLIAEGGTTFGRKDTGVPQFSLGGQKGLLSYGSNELRGNQYLLVSGGYLHELWRLPALVGRKVYAVGEVEAGRMTSPTSDSAVASATLSRWPVDAAAGLIAQTAFGPFFVGGRVGNHGNRGWFFKLGRVF